MTILCPRCGRRGRVLESRPKVPDHKHHPSAVGTLRRRRECRECAVRWATVEVLETVDNSLPAERSDLLSMAERIEALARAHPCWSQAHEAVRVLTGYLRAMHRLEEVNRRYADEQRQFPRAGE